MRDTVVPPGGNGGWRETTTDAGGNFKLEGLGDGPYELEAVGEGCMPAVNPLLPGRPVYTSAAAPSSDCRLVVAAVRVFRLRLLHGGTREPVGSMIDSLGVAGIHGLLAGSRVQRTGTVKSGGSKFVLGPQEDASVHVGLVQFRRGDGTADHATVLVQVRGYRPASARVRLLLPIRLAESSEVDEIELVPDPPHGVGMVSATCPRNSAGLRRDPRMVLYVRGDQTRAILGSPAREGSWNFSGVPAGTHEMTIYDGISESSPREVTVQEGARCVVRFEFEPPTGATLDLVDELGRPLFDADFVSFRRVDPSPQRREPEHAEDGNTVMWYDEWAGTPDDTAPAIEPDGRAPLKKLVEIPFPGRYEVTVVKQGYRPGSAKFEVLRAAVSTVQVQLSKTEK